MLEQDEPTKDRIKMAKEDAAVREARVRTITEVPQQHDFKNWQELTGFAAICTRGNWIFRGESFPIKNPRPLRPKAGRPEWNKGQAIYSLAKEKAALETFKRQARSLVGHEPKSDLEWLAVAQHYGMPTRLLDWTENLLAAAYFATIKMNTSWGIIYALRDLRATSPRDEKSPFRVARPCVYRPPHISPRISVQQSVFTLHPDPTQPFGPEGIHMWRVPPGVATQVKEILDACSINQRSLFPDLDGLAQQLGWDYKWGKL